MSCASESFTTAPAAGTPADGVESIDSSPWTAPLSLEERAALVAAATRRAHELRRAALHAFWAGLLSAPVAPERAQTRLAARLQRHRAWRLE